MHGGGGSIAAHVECDDEHCICVLTCWLDDSCCVVVLIHNDILRQLVMRYAVTDVPTTSFKVLYENHK